ncbi:MAG: DUF2304 family protein [Patescibacteria group bacterium]
MTIFQLTAVFFALFMSYVVTIKHKKQVLNSLELSFWLSIWGLFVIFAAFPNLLLDMTDILHFSRVFDLLVVVAFMVLSILIFKSYFDQKELNKKIEDLVRQDSISELKKRTA